MSPGDNSSPSPCHAMITDESDTHGTELSPAILDEFMNSLQRLFKIGLYYPSGHAILDKATYRFLDMLEKLAGDKRQVTIGIFNTTLVVEDIELDKDQPHVRDFNLMLSTLGISAISIDKHISAAEILDFVRKMTAYKGRVQSSRQFIQVDVGGLPPSVTIEQKEFLARAESVTAGDGEAADNLESFVASLADHGLSDEEIHKCRTLLDNLPQQMTRTDIDISDLPYASWDDVARLLARAVRGGNIDKDGRLLASSHSNINALAAILKNLELETRDRKSREAINLLISIIKKPLEDTPLESAEKDTLTRRSFPAKPAVDVRQIQNFADKQRLNSDILAKLSRSSHDNEILSILIQLCHFEQSLSKQIRMQYLMRETLSKQLSEKTWKILSGGLHAIASSGKQTRLAATLHLVLEPIRRSTHASTLQLFQQIVKLCDREALRLLWPHLVNELLVVGSSRDKIIYHSLCQTAARMPNEHMVAALPQLQGLESFQESKIASDIFHAVSPSCFPLFAFLLKTDIERYVSERVLGGLRRNPRDWLIKGVSPLLDMSQQEHKLFLYSYLRQAFQKTLSAPLKKIAARIITENLPLLSQERRSEQWVEGSIAALGQLPAERSAELLKQIAGGRKLLFIPDWPAPCRSAAEKALADIRGKH